MLTTRAHLTAGETMLGWGAGSGVGSAAIQVAKVLGAKVIATAGNDEKLEKARRLGADHGVNHHSQDVPAEVKRFMHGNQSYVFLEQVGRASWERTMICSAP